MTPLHVAAANGANAAVALLLRFGSPVWHRDAAGHLALDVATQQGHREAGDLLLAAMGTQADVSTAVSSVERRILSTSKLLKGPRGVDQTPVRCVCVWVC
jgi:ankyrin repeat protein